VIELYQFAGSPFCEVQRQILAYSRARFKIVNVPAGDRAGIWKLTRQRYYGLPVIRDGRNVVFETDDDSQAISKYLDAKLRLGLFPAELEGLQSILWRVIENDVEGFAFRLNNIYWRQWVPKSDRLYFLRHKERKFGRGCLEKWAEQKPELLAGLARSLLPFEQMLQAQPFLLGPRPRFVDFNLHGMLACFLFPGHDPLSAELPRLQKWYDHLSQLKIAAT